MALLSFCIDLVLAGLLVSGLIYAARLSRQLQIMRESHAEMKQFIANFNATVSRAEAGIRGLKAASRSAGDDLELLIENGQKLRDELQFLIESADQIATRLTDKAGARAHAAAEAEETKRPTAAPAAAMQPTPPSPLRREPAAEMPASSAERELLRALQKRK